MSDINNVLSILCKYIDALTNVKLDPEWVRLIKYNVPDESVAQILWEILQIFSCYAVKRKSKENLDFQNYGTSILSSVKLHYAFLQYPMLEFYSLSESNDRNRDLLIALAWLLSTENVLTTVLEMKLANGPLGTECSYVPTSQPTLATTQFNKPASNISNILHLNGKVNLNLKEISELISERSKLISKVHAVSIGAGGLPHLSVSELALIKRIALKTDGDKYSEQDEKYLRELYDAEILLNVHAKWLEKRHVFFDWMSTVIQENRKSMESNPRRINCRQLSIFISLLQRVINERVESLDHGKTAGDRQEFSSICTSRLLRDQCHNTKTERWLDELNEHQNLEEKNLEQSRKRLVAELKEMLTLIPFSIRV